MRLRQWHRARYSSRFSAAVFRQKPVKIETPKAHLSLLDLRRRGTGGHLQLSSAFSTDCRTGCVDGVGHPASQGRRLRLIPAIELSRHGVDSRSPISEFIYPLAKAPRQSMRWCKPGAVDIDPIAERWWRRRPPLRPPIVHRCEVDRWMAL
jgi:hypothetical protein